MLSSVRSPSASHHNFVWPSSYIVLYGLISLYGRKANKCYIEKISFVQNCSMHSCILFSVLNINSDVNFLLLKEVARRSVRQSMDPGRVP